MIRRGHGAFTLLEVLVSLAILAIALTMIMRSFTTSLRASRLQERTTVATMLARHQIDSYEVMPPPEGTSSGKFAGEFDGYSYEVEYTEQVVDYPDIPSLDEVGRMVSLRRVAVDIFWTPPGDSKTRPRRILHVESALTGSERYTFEARKQNNLLNF